MQKSARVQDRPLTECKKRREGKQQTAGPVGVVQVEEDHISPLNVLQSHSPVPPLQVKMEMDSPQMLMEMDTGADGGGHWNCILHH